MACVGHLTLWVVQELRDRAEFEAKVRGLKLVQSEWTKGTRVKEAEPGDEEAEGGDAVDEEEQRRCFILLL